MTGPAVVCYLGVACCLTNVGGGRERGDAGSGDGVEE